MSKEGSMPLTGWAIEYVAFLDRWYRGRVKLLLGAILVELSS